MSYEAFGTEETQFGGMKRLQLWGHDFPVVEEGLCEASVVTFVNKLIEERNSLAKCQEQLIHLHELAERMVVEAGGMAAAIKQEAETEAATVRQQAEVEASALVNAAKSRADEISNEAATVRQQAEAEASALVNAAKSRVDEINNEAARIIAEATKKGNDVLDKAQQEVELLKEKISEEIEREVEATLAKLCNQTEILAHRIEQELSSELNNLCQNIRAVRAKCRGRPTNNEPEPIAGSLAPPELSGSVPIEATRNITGIPVQAEVKTSSIVLSAEAEVGPPPNSTGTPESLYTLKLESELYDGEIELSIAPPVDAIKILRLMEGVQTYPEIQIKSVVTSLIGPGTMTLFLEKPIDLIALLKSIDGIIIYGSGNDNSHSEKVRRLAIELAR